MPAPPRVTLAVIMGAHGVAGAVRLKLFAESLDSLRRYETFDTGGRTLTLKTAEAAGKGVVARFAEIGSRDAAEALRGVELTVPRDALPALGEGEFYAADLIGRAAVSESGVHIGKVVAVENYGAHDILEIRTESGTAFMVPFTHEAVPKVGAAITLAAAFVAGG